MNRTGARPGPCVEPAGASQAKPRTIGRNWPEPTRVTRASRQQMLLRKNGIELQVVKLPEAKKGFVPLPERWVVERSYVWLAGFRRLSRDFERMPEVLPNCISWSSPCRCDPR